MTCRSDARVLRPMALHLPRMLLMPSRAASATRMMA